MQIQIGDELKLIYLKRSQYQFKVCWDLPEQQNRITLPDEDHPLVVVVGWQECYYSRSTKEIVIAVKPLLSRFKCEKGYDWEAIFVQNSLKNLEHLDRILGEKLSDDGYWFEFILDECIESITPRKELTCKFCSRIVKPTDEGICYDCWRDDHFRKLGI